MDSNVPSQLSQLSLVSKEDEIVQSQGKEQIELEKEESNEIQSQSNSNHSSLGRPTNTSSTHIKKGRFSVMESNNTMGDTLPTKLVTFASVDSLVDSPTSLYPRKFIIYNLESISHSLIAERKQSRFAIQDPGSLSSSTGIPSPILNENEKEKVESKPFEINRSTSSRFKVSTQSSDVNISPMNGLPNGNGSSMDGQSVITDTTRGRFKISPTFTSSSSLEGKYDTEMIQQILQGPDLSHVSSLEEKNQILLLHNHEQRNVILYLMTVLGSNST